MKREAEPILRPSKRHEAANMDNALAAMERSGSSHFVKTLPQTAIPALTPNGGAYLTIPAQFVRENAHKFEEWVILRIQSSNGRSSRPWVVRLRISVSSVVATSVRFAIGWKDFAADNGLRMSDSLIFLLKEGVRSEFKVHVLRGPEGSPYFPDLFTTLDDDDDDEDKEEKYVSNSIKEESFEEDLDDSDHDYKHISHVRSRVHHRHARTRASLGNGRDCKAAPEQQIKHSENDEVFPGFRKLLSVTHIRQSDGLAGQFEFPRQFLRTHGVHIQASVQLQGIYEDSSVYVVPCYRSKHDKAGQVRISLRTNEWSRFVKANRLKAGLELQFSLIADSHFKVREI